MKRRSLIPITGAILAMMFVCVTICCAAQAAAKYVLDQEKKNVLVASMGENVDVLRSCLQPASNLTPAGAGLNVSAKEISGIVPSAGAISVPVNSSPTAIAPSPREEIAGKEKSAGK